MKVRMGMVGLLAAAGVMAVAGAGRAADVFRLAISDNSSTPTMILGTGSAEADTIDVRGGGRGGGGGFHGGGFRGGSYGGYRGFAGGFRGGYGGYRGYYGGYGGYLGGLFRGYYGGYYPGYYNYYYPQVVPYYPDYYYYPISTVTPSVPATTFTLRIGPVTTQVQARRLPVLPNPTLRTQPLYPQPAPTPGRPADGTFDYDGGPRVPVPLPKAEPAPMNPQPTVPLDGRPVSLPVRSTPVKYYYPAYGEQPRKPAATDRSIPVSTDAGRRVQ